MQNPAPKIIIIGAGIAGLSAALHLAERGLQPLVLEAGTRPGGRLAGAEPVQIDGRLFPLEHGVHGIWSPYVNLKAMLARHTLLPKLTPAREEQWFYRHKGFSSGAPIGNAIRHSLFPAPLHYLQLFLNPRFLLTIDVRDWLRLFHVWSVLVMAVGVDPFGENQPLEELSLAGALADWSPALRALFVALTHNGLSSHSDHVSLAGFLAFLRFYTLLRRDAWAFGYLPEGGGALTESLSAAVTRLGGEIRLGVRVTRLEKDGDWRVAWEQDGRPGVDCAPFVILATDSPAAESLLKGSFPAAAGTLFFPRGMANAIIRLWFRRAPKPGPEAGLFSGDYAIHNFFWLERLYAPYRAWHSETGGSAIEAHIYGPPETLAQPDALLLTQAITDVYRAYPELRGQLLGQHLQRNAATHTLPALGTKDKHLGIITPWDGLLCAGDWVRDEMPSFFLERACATGIKAANAVLTARGCEAFTLKDYPQPEILAGWMQALMVYGRKRVRKKKELTTKYTKEH
jgi:isorenieratene synthase